MCKKRGSFCQALITYGKRGAELQPVLEETVCVYFREHQVLEPKFSISRGGLWQKFTLFGLFGIRLETQTPVVPCRLIHAV